MPRDTRSVTQRSVTVRQTDSLARGYTTEIPLHSGIVTRRNPTHIPLPCQIRKIRRPGPFGQRVSPL